MAEEVRQTSTESVTQARPTKARAFGRSRCNFSNLNKAEKRLIAAVRVGGLANFGDKVPDAEDEQKLGTIRADLVRFLALGGDELIAVHENGLRIRGGWIEGDINLEFCNVVAPIFLDHCHINGAISISNATIPSLSIQGCVVREIKGERLTCLGSLHLNQGSRMSGCNFEGVHICGNLNCQDSIFETPQDYECSFDFTGAKIDGDVLLCAEHAKCETYVHGYAQFNGATIGGDVDCTGATFENGIWFIGSRIAGDLDLSEAVFGSDCPGDASKNSVDIVLSRVTVEGRLFFRVITGRIDTVTLRAAKCAALVDDNQSWNLVTKTALDGFEYRRFLDAEIEASGAQWIDNRSPADAKSRIAWLSRQREEDLRADFKPQPWEQLIKVLREMGHVEDARIVAIEKQKRIRAAGKKAGIANTVHWVYGISSSFGYRPARILIWALLIAVIWGGIFEVGATNGVFGPADGALYEKIMNISCRPETGGNWTRCPELSARNMHFNPLIYSFDIILPIIGLQQAKAWTVLTSEKCSVVGPLGFCDQTPTPGTAAEKSALSLIGVIIWFFAKLENILGWLAGLMFVGVVSGFVKKD